MAYRLSVKDADLAAAFRRIAAEEARAAVAKIAADDDAGAHRAVHEVRKHGKKLRALIRLFRPVFADHAEENAVIRDAARRLSGLRDRAVMLQTHDGLAAALPAGAERRRLAPIRARLTRLARTTAAVEDLAAELARYGEVMAALAARAENWQLSAGGRPALEPGLARVWKQARRTLAAAKKSPSAETIHEWRKRVKDHWYHARILEPVFPEMIAPQRALADELGEALGDHNDLAVYRRWLDGPESDGLDKSRRAAADALAAGRQKLLLTRSLTIGQRLFAEPPEAMAARWAAWWEIWRAETD